MSRALRSVLVLLLASSVLVVVPGEVDATVPGDIGRIVFVSNRDHAYGEIYVRDFAGSTATRLTNNTLEDFGPKWSPDGTLIAFNQNIGTEMVPQVDIHVMDADGSNEINLTNNPAIDDWFHDWSPDGMRILFSSERGGNPDLWTMRLDGSDPQQLTNTASSEWDSDWSPDGSTIAYCTQDQIWLMDSDGSEPRQLTAAADGCDPSWSPDGTRLTYDSHATGTMNVWTIDADGTNPVNITNDPMEYYHHPVWSPDGSWIAFERLSTDWELLMVRPDGSDIQLLTNSPTTLEYNVDWESVNRVPIVVDDEATVHRGQSVEIAPLSNDSDLDGEEIEVGDITRMPDEGTVTIDPSGVVTYTHNGLVAPPGQAVPYTDSFDYRVDDERLGSSTGTVQVWIYPYFDDVPTTNLFFEHVLWLAVEGITFGCNPPSNTLFCPTDYVTRGQMAAFLVRARSYTAGAGDDLFIDDNGSVFEGSIDRLGTAGVTKGCNPPVDDRFCPNTYVTRGQMAAFLVRAFALPDLGADDLFADDNGSVFEESIDRLGATGVSKGCNPPDNDRFCPNAYVTRQQMAAFISRATSYGQE